MRFLLDTNIVSEPMKPRPDTDVLRLIDEHSESVAIASIVWHELWFGLARLSDGKRKHLLHRYLADVVGETMTILPYDARAASWHARERARLTAEGNVPSFADGQIAAVAAVHELTLITRNVNDFERFDGLGVEDWFAGRHKD